MSLSKNNKREGDSDSIREFVAENHDLITRVLAYGDSEARGYALALLANGGTVADVERVQRELQVIKENLSE